MKIIIKDFLSLKNVSFEIEKGITVIAGKNGCGKSQLLLGVAQKNSGGSTMHSYGFSEYNYKKPTQIVLTPEPSLVLYRPAVRRIAENNREKEFANIQPLSDIFDASDNHKKGYSGSVNTRYHYMYTIIASLFVCGELNTANRKQQEDWKIIKESFNRVFNKLLNGEGDTHKGIKVGVVLPSGSVVSFNTLSTGELEFLSLMCDLVLERTDSSSCLANDGKPTLADMILIDELDAHFHPDLQRVIINEMAPYCKDKYVLISTHSPAVMLSVPQDRLFYLQHFSECVKSREPVVYNNQISLVAENSELYKILGEIYKGFTSDVNLAIHFSNAQNYQIQEYAEQCLKESIALDAKTSRDCDPQILCMAAKILSIENPVIVEFGCGKGRTLAMLKQLDDEKLSKTTYYGIDIDSANLATLKTYAQEIGLLDRGLKIITDQPIPENSVDLYIFCNLLHEIPTLLCEVFNNGFKALKENGAMMILEALELAVGEQGFMMMYPNSLKTLLNSQKEKGNITYSCLSPTSHGGTPLMMACITVLNPTETTIQNDDVVRCIADIINIESDALSEHYNGNSKLSSIAFSYKSHNIANAVMYKKMYE